MKYIYTILLVSCLSLPFLSFSQSTSGAPHLGIGWTGLMYTGDLTVDETDYLRMYPGANMFLQFGNDKAFRLRFNAGFGKVVEQEDRRFQTLEEVRQSNNYFETNLFYFDLRLMRYFFRRGPVQPYIGIGPSILFFNPKDQDGNFLIDNIFTRELGEEFPTTIFVWPATAGLSFPLSKSLRLNVDYTYRLNMSDYIDNIGLLGRDPGKDQLHAFQVGFDVRLGINRKPKVIEPQHEPLKSIILASNKAQSDKTGLKGLQYRAIDADHHKKADRINEEEIDHVLYYQMPVRDSFPEAEVYAPSSERKTEPVFEKKFRKQLLVTIMTKQLYKKTKNTGILSRKAVASKHHLREEELLKINPQMPELVKHGFEYLAPDWDAAIEADQ